MPTQKSRLSITIEDKAVEAALIRAAELKGKSRSSLAYELIVKALQDDDDLYFSDLANERDRDNVTYSDYSGDVWR